MQRVLCRFIRDGDCLVAKMSFSRRRTAAHEENGIPFSSCDGWESLYGEVTETRAQTWAQDAPAMRPKMLGYCMMADHKYGMGSKR